MCREWVGDEEHRTLDMWNGLEELVRVVVLRVGRGGGVRASWCAWRRVSIISARRSICLRKMQGAMVSMIADRRWSVLQWAAFVVYGLA